MKASIEFVNQIADGIRALREKYGSEAVAAASPWQVYWAVHDSVSPGFEHNAKMEMPKNPAFHEEGRRLKDAHIETAIKAAMKLVD